MTILAIETSTPTGSLALDRGGRILEERVLPGLARGGGRFLLPELMAMLQRHQVRPGEIQLVAVSIGPGGFTGLRLGLTCAKTFAWAQQIPLAAVDTFAAIAENSPNAKSIAILAEAQRRGVLAGIYQNSSPEPWRRQGEFHLIPTAEMADRLGGAELVSGPGLAAAAPSQLAGLPLAPPKAWLPRAAVIARLGQDLFQRGELADPYTLEPRYTRPSAAEEKRRSK